MPITILDLVLLGVMLISGLLAMVRGFMREILSIAAWGAAALVTCLLSRSCSRPLKLISTTIPSPASWWWPACSSAR
jgi:uncharacterized membrane protein required for colicin V production